jgi:hypothetical protein
MLALLAHWIKGNSLAQTLFTCLYLHKPELIVDPTLKVCSLLSHNVDVDDT